MAAIPIVDGAIFISTLVDAMDGAGGLALETSARLVNHLRPVILTTFVLYIMLWGFAMMKGLISEVVQDGLSRIFKLAIVMGLVLGFGGKVYFDPNITADVPVAADNILHEQLVSTESPILNSLGTPGVYQLGAQGSNKLYIKYVYNFIWNGSENLFEFITGYKTKQVVMASQALSFMYTLGFDYFQQGIKTGGDSIDLVMFGLGSVTVLAGTMLAATIITTLVFAKFMLAILLSVGPIFIVLMLFDGTRRLFEAWLGQVLSNVILLVIFGMAVNMVLMVLWSVLQTHFTVYMADRVLNLLGDIIAGSDITTSASAPSPASGVGIVLVCVVLHQFLSRVPPVADSIGRSLSLSLNTGLARK